MPRTSLIRLAVCLLALALSGCTRKVPMGQVDGTVRVDGAPVADLMILFVPEDRSLPQSTGFSDADGHFQLRCSNGAPGAAVGRHRVVVLDAARAPSGKGKDDDDLPEGKDVPNSRIPMRFSRPDKTPLRQSVEAGSQEVEIEIAVTGKSR